MVCRSGVAVIGRLRLPPEGRHHRSTGDSLKRLPSLLRLSLASGSLASGRAHHRDRLKRPIIAVTPAITASATALRR